MITGTGICTDQRSVVIPISVRICVRFDKKKKVRRGEAGPSHPDDDRFEAPFNPGGYPRTDRLCMLLLGRPCKGTQRPTTSLVGIHSTAITVPSTIWSISLREHQLCRNGNCSFYNLHEGSRRVIRLPQCSSGECSIGEGGETLQAEGQARGRRGRLVRRFGGEGDRFDRDESVRTDRLVSGVESTITGAGSANGAARWLSRTSCTSRRRR